MQTTQALQRYLTQLRADGRSAHTVAQYQRHIRLLDDWLEHERGSVDLDQIDHEVLAEFLVSPAARNRRGGGEKRATSMNALRSSLRTYFAYLHGAGYIRANPARLIRRARTASASPRALTEAEQERLLDVLRREDGGRDFALVALMLELGLRISSALRLSLDDIDFVAGEVVLRTKGDRPSRMPLPRSIATQLQRYVATAKSGPLFAGANGQPVTARHVNRRLRFWAERAGIDPISSHALRHSFAMRIYRKTGDLHLTQVALLHASPASTTAYVQTDLRRLRGVLGA